jgi:PhzF family phenazine biosynthesis protein
VRLPITWVDSFSERPFGGNPAAVCTLDAPAPEEWMQALARELGLSETAFVVPGATGFSLRWFTPTTEVDLCGHATLAAAHVLRADGAVAADAEIRFHTRSGELRARLQGELIELDFPADPPRPARLPEPLAGLAGVLECRRSGFFLLVALDSADAVAELVPDLTAVRAVADRAVLVTAAGGPPGVDYVLRVFAPAVGIDEDPVTGSAQCVAGPYWAERLGRSRLAVAQLSARGGRLTVGVLRGGRVSIAGRAVTVLTGEVEGP